MEQSRNRALGKTVCSCRQRRKKAISHYRSFILLLDCGPFPSCLSSNWAVSTAVTLHTHLALMELSRKTERCRGHEGRGNEGPSNLFSLIHQNTHAYTQWKRNFSLEGWVQVFYRAAAAIMALTLVWPPALMLSGLNQIQGFFVSTVCQNKWMYCISLLNLTIVNNMCMTGKTKVAWENIQQRKSKCMATYYSSFYGWCVLGGAQRLSLGFFFFRKATWQHDNEVTLRSG